MVYIGEVGAMGGTKGAMAKPEEHAVVLFDGVCTFCNRSVQFVIQRDRGGYFRFASQQSGAGSALLAAFPKRRALTRSC